LAHVKNGYKLTFFKNTQNTNTTCACLAANIFHAKKLDYVSSSFYLKIDA